MCRSDEVLHPWIPSEHSESEAKSLDEARNGENEETGSTSSGIEHSSPDQLENAIEIPQMILS